MASLCFSFSSNLLISAMASAISSSASLDSLKIKLKKYVVEKCYMSNMSKKGLEFHGVKEMKEEINVWTEA